ncbi:MAG: IclR family transcriptional regulator [Rhizobiaceae bacterium]
MEENGRIPTNLRTLRILEVLGKSDSPMTPTEINRELGLPKQTVHRLCATLTAEGYLVPDIDRKRLRPSRRLRQLASGVLFASRYHVARHQILVDVAKRVRETVNFVVPEDKGMTYMDRVETDWPFRIQLPIGSHVPFHCTASGKTFLASLKPAARRAMVNSIELEKLTSNTHDNSEGLMSELEEISEQGYALDREEFMEGMIAIAVPVSDPSGRFFAALAYHGPTQRVSLGEAVKDVAMLKSAAERLTSAIFV